MKSTTLVTASSSVKKPRKSIFKDPTLSKCMCFPSGETYVSVLVEGKERVIICSNCLVKEVESLAETARGS
jgi:hypothetical protein